MASSAAPALLFSIIFPLFFFSSSTLVSAAGDHCAPSSCGNLTNIRYPFRLKDDPPNCGDSKYELTCNHLNHTILTPLFPNYYITNITYNDYSYYDIYFEIQVKDVRMEKYNNINNNGSCSHPPLLPYPLTFSKLMGNPYYWTFDWVTLVNCSKEVKNKSRHHYYNYYRPVPCLSHNNNSSFIYYLIESFSVGDLMVSCSLLATFPYNKQSGQKPTDDMFKLLAQAEYTFYGVISRRDTIRDCFRKSFREIYQDISNQEDSIMRRIFSVWFRIDGAIFGCLGPDNPSPRTEKHYSLMVAIGSFVVILLQIAKAWIGTN